MELASGVALVREELGDWNAGRNSLRRRGGLGLVLLAGLAFLLLVWQDLSDEMGLE